MLAYQKRILESIRKNGIGQLTDADLLVMILWGRGTKRDHEWILKSLRTITAEKGNVTNLLKTDADELLSYQFDEMSTARLLALLELIRRLAQPEPKIQSITSAYDVISLIGAEMRHLNHEEMAVLVLDNKNHLVANINMYRGTVNSSVLRASEAFRPAIVRNCPNIIICHNHPSGDPNPSPEDMTVTRDLVEAGKLLNIDVLDHIIIGNPGFVSLHETMKW
ncbi:hypothetical protein EPA93_43260 [Ktedonosporobacter rubrisoli]|uniref:MPN domain-containing protein n=1 Tax=Ktedonosporobacter rubrisoli TaxID=2509675 RepID=A0A4P6K325_KTERU|nr:JAB domain-containing protein [Ktedonosporobacter rubrisoli]QBD82435.1 hypothetical protein EPA93_43260 [Ktedonosporobacter rubrisoli]